MASQAVYLLDADPDLADALDPETRVEVHRYAVARVLRVPDGRWQGGGEFWGDENAVGLLVLRGLVTRQLQLDGRRATELLGSGDMLRPWQEDEGRPGLHVRWVVHEPLGLAVIDRRVLLVAARWPALGEALFHRAFRRSRALAFYLAMTQMRGVDRRLLVLFWDGAGRWGRVTPEGVCVRLPLTHQTLAELVGSRRPSVTLALAELAEAGKVIRHGDDWLLTGDPPELSDGWTPAAAIGL